MANDTYEALCLARSAEKVARKGSHRDLESRSRGESDRRGVEEYRLQKKSEGGTCQYSNADQDGAVAYRKEACRSVSVALKDVDTNLCDGCRW